MQGSSAGTKHSEPRHSLPAQAGIKICAQQGRWYSGRPPFGYTLTDGQLTPDSITAPTVRRIFKLYVEDRLGTIAIAQQLRAEHAPAPAAGWGHPAVQRVLTNPTYLGRIRWRDQDSSPRTTR